MKMKGTLSILLCAALLIGITFLGVLTITAAADPISDSPETTTASVSSTEPAIIENTEQTVIADSLPTETQTDTATVSHIEACVEGCIIENCECECHKDSLLEKALACTSLEEFESVMMEAAEEDKAALTEEELQKIEAHANSLMPEPLPAIEISKISAEPVISEIVHVTVNYTNVAPLVDAEE